MNYTDLIYNILLATCLGFIAGLERELSGHKGSIKANILIMLGSCIFVSYERFMGSDTRIAANIVTGVGFLCSGYIFKNGMSVKGLSTAQRFGQVLVLVFFAQEVIACRRFL